MQRGARGGNVNVNPNREGRAGGRADVNVAVGAGAGVGAVSSRKQMVGCLIVWLGTATVVAGLATQAWITGIAVGASYHVGLLSVGVVCR